MAKAETETVAESVTEAVTESEAETEERRFFAAFPRLSGGPRWPRRPRPPDSDTPLRKLAFRRG